MKKLATLKAAPLAAATLFSFAGAAPVSAAAHAPMAMPAMPMTEIMHSMGGHEVPYMGLPMGGDMWTMPHAMMMSSGSQSAGVVDDFAATITIVHATVNVSSTSMAPKNTETHHNAKPAYSEPKEEKHHEEEKHHDKATHANYEHTADKPKEHATEDDCLKDDESHKAWSKDAHDSHDTWNKHEAEKTNDWSDDSDKKSYDHAVDWSWKSDDHAANKHDDKHMSWGSESSEDADCPPTDEWSHDQKNNSHEDWSWSDNKESNHWDDKHYEHASAYMHKDDAKSDCYKADDCPPADDCL